MNFSFTGYLITIPCGWPIAILCQNGWSRQIIIQEFSRLVSEKPGDVSFLSASSGQRAPKPPMTARTICFSLVWRWELIGRFTVWNITGTIICLHKIGVFYFYTQKNASNKINLIGMLFMVWYLWPPGDRIFLKCYRHWSSLVLRNGNGTVSILHSMEGVT